VTPAENAWKIEHHEVIKFLTLEGVPPKDIVEHILIVYRYDTVSHGKVKTWTLSLKCGQATLKDEHHPILPSEIPKGILFTDFIEGG
jgi:hypothetical protein